jgi:hypothetical protein
MIAMKATKLLIAAAALAGVASLGFAGPGPEYWARMNATNKKPAYPSIWQTKSTETKAKPAPQPPAEVTSTCTSCGCSAKKV